MTAEALLHAIGTIDERYICEAAPKEKTTSQSKPAKASIRIRRFTLIAASFVVLLAVIAAARNIWNPIEPQRILTTLAAGQHEAKVVLDGGELNFISDISLIAGAPPYIDPQTTYQEKWSLNTVIEYLGRDFRPNYVPDDLHSSDEEPFWTVIFNNDGTRVPYSFTFGLWYSESFDDEYNPLRRTLDVKAAKGELPFQCGVYAAETETPSNIDGVEITVGYCKMSYGPYVGDDKIPAGYYGVYVANFMYEGIGYDIKSENLTQEEFINVLLSIVK